MAMKETFRQKESELVGSPASTGRLGSKFRQPANIPGMIRLPARHLIGLLLLLACGSEPDERIFGTYVLVSVEGSPLPYLATSDADCDVYLAEGELTLNEAGTYALEFFGPYDCSRGGGPSGESIGRFYTGSFTQSEGTLQFETQVEGGALVEFSGTANPLEARVTVPVLPPQTGPDLELQFAATQ
jgi:hypothetical protein